MPRLLRLIVIGIITLSALFSPTLSAHAATTDAARSAARWVAANLTGDPDDPDDDVAVFASTTADALIALAAGQDPSTTDEAVTLLTALRTTGPEYAQGDPQAAAKLAIALDAVGQDPRTFFPGIDLIALVKAGVQDDGSFGSFVSPFSLGLAATALARAGEPVPAALITKLGTFQLANGAFSWAANGDADPDMTALAVLALTAAKETTMRAKAVTWAEGAQQTDGRWTSFNDVNATAILGAALASAKVDVTQATAWMVSQQQASGAFLNGGVENMMATTQAVLLLGGVSYLDVSWPVALPTTEPEPEPTETTTPPAPEPTLTVPAPVETTAPQQPAPVPTTTRPTPSPSKAATTRATASASPSRTATDRLPQTGTSSEPWFIAAAGVLALGGATLLLARRFVR